MNIIKQDLEHILRHTRDLWGELRGKRIFITGGTGFFGRWLLESFAYVNTKLDLKASITVLSRNPDAFILQAPELCSNPAITFCRGDVRDFIFPEEEYPFIIHCATDASAKLNDEAPLLMFDTITQGTRRTLDFAAHAKCRKFLLISSGAVYGKQPPAITHIPETYTGAPDTMNPANAYGEGKRAAELLCTLYHKAHPELETKIARCFAFVGPYLPLDTHFAIGNFIRDALNGGPIRVNGDGTPYRSYLYASDLAIWLWTILIKGKECQPYNVGSKEDLPVADLAHKVANIHGNIKVNIALSTKQGISVSRYVPSVFLAEKELKLKAEIGLDEAIRRSINYASNQKLFSKTIRG